MNAQTSQTLRRVTDSHIREALAELNATNGKTYTVPSVKAIGYAYWADIKGDGRNVRSVWVIVNQKGGVSRSDLNGGTMRKTLANIERAIVAARAA